MPLKQRSQQDTNDVDTAAIHEYDNTMKTMTCKQLGGACDKAFQANTFEALVELSKQHGMEMFQQQDPAHLETMAKVMQLMQSPEAMNAWMDERRNEFDALAED
jgi:hypothetical protein